MRWAASLDLLILDHSTLRSESLRPISLPSAGDVAVGHHLDEAVVLADWQTADIKIPRCARGFVQRRHRADPLGLFDMSSPDLQLSH